MFIGMICVWEGGSQQTPDRDALGCSLKKSLTFQRLRKQELWSIFVFPTSVLVLCQGKLVNTSIESLV